MTRAEFFIHHFLPLRFWAKDATFESQNAISSCTAPNQRPGMKTRLGSTQTKKIGHYIRFAGNVLLWGKSVIRIEIHFLKSKCFQGRYSSQDADVQSSAPNNTMMPYSSHGEPTTGPNSAVASPLVPTSPLAPASTTEQGPHPKTVMAMPRAGVEQFRGLSVNGPRPIGPAP